MLVHRRHQSHTAGATIADIGENDHSPSVGFVLRELRANVGRALGVQRHGGAFVSALLDVESLKLLANLRHFDDLFLFQQIWLSKLSRQARHNVGSLLEDAYLAEHEQLRRDSASGSFANRQPSTE